MVILVGKLTFREFYLIIVVIPIFLTFMLSAHGHLFIGLLAQASIGYAGIKFMDSYDNYVRWIHV